MADRPRMTLTATVLDTPDPRGLARFYAALLDWPIGTDDPEWVTLRPGGPALSFQLEPDHVPPVWPAGKGDPRMQLHLDVAVDDLAAAVEFAVSLGATVAGFQPQDDVRVMRDPAGHPFCLYIEG
ncbi:VOC family protein [uncultured Modestobacter sp.]|uniref:VOC family protein n=1 Tax=uncultured Modestobacter sp. TaxID=380048 RepID=UPI00262DBD4A|nr:VOC family protein [uncultured Modestobacter sp.]